MDPIPGGNVAPLSLTLELPSVPSNQAQPRHPQGLTRLPASPGPSSIADNISKEEHNLVPKSREHGLCEKDIIFIKELIYGPLHSGQVKDTGESWTFQGRGPEKDFLSVDVDKWDYMLRDAAARDVKIVFNYKRFINNSDIAEVDGKMRLAIRDKESENMLSLFSDRARLHKNNYQHKTVKLVVLLLPADPHLELLGRDAQGRTVTMSNACIDVANLSELSYNFVLKGNQHSSGPELEAARRLVNRFTTSPSHRPHSPVQLHVGPLPPDPLTSSLGWHQVSALSLPPEAKEDRPQPVEYQLLRLQPQAQPRHPQGLIRQPASLRPLSLAADTYKAPTLGLTTGASLRSAPKLPPGHLKPKTANPSPLLQLRCPPSRPPTSRPSRLAAVTSVDPGEKTGRGPWSSADPQGLLAPAF